MSKFCSNCGSELKENADICLSCGTFISSSRLSSKKQIPSDRSSKSYLLTFIASIFTSIGMMLLLWSFAWMYLYQSSWGNYSYVSPEYDFAMTSVLFFIVACIIQIISLVFASIDYKNTVIQKSTLFFQISFTIFNLCMFLVSTAAIS